MEDLKVIKKKFGEDMMRLCRKLFPSLLEEKGLLSSRWETGGSKPRKYYLRTPYGDTVYRRLKELWAALSDGIDALLQEDEP